MLCHYKLPVDEFIEKHYSPHLTLYKWHRFQYTILSKRYITDVRLKTLQVGDIGTQRDFAERCKMEFHGQVQCNYYNGGRVISIEGVAVWFIPDDGGEITMSFHSYLSDGKVQNAAVALNHMEKMVAFLMKPEIAILKKGGRILEQTDGAGSQYKCASAFF